MLVNLALLTFLGVFNQLYIYVPIFLPIINELGYYEQTDGKSECLAIFIVAENEIGVVAAWDSSAHEDPKLNRVTPDHEKLYMIVRVVARLTDPAAVGEMRVGAFR